MVNACPSSPAAIYQRLDVSSKKCQICGTFNARHTNHNNISYSQYDSKGKINYAVCVHGVCVIDNITTREEKAVAPSH